MRHFVPPPKDLKWRDPTTAEMAVLLGEFREGRNEVSWMGEDPISAYIAVMQERIARLFGEDCWMVPSEASRTCLVIVPRTPDSEDRYVRYRVSL